MDYINFNGKIIPADQPVLLASNRGYRYGDGLFETMKVFNGKLILGSFHFERLFAALSLLKFNVPKLFTIEKGEKEILILSAKNECSELARVRLSVFRGNGSLYDQNEELQYIIECWPINESVHKLNEDGLVIDIYSEARKACDMFSNIKSANFLPYTMAALYARENKLNDCLVMNTAGNISDSTIANIFIIKNELIITPALSEGCVKGVIRRYLLERLKIAGYNIEESSISVSDLENADEVFLTNAINGIRWIKQFRDKTYANLKTIEIYNRLIQPIFI
jgi:branched-chain amino acid aminotransferase